MNEPRANRRSLGRRRAIWEVEGPDRFYSVEVGSRRVVFAETGPPPTYGAGGSCSLRRFLDGEMHDWVAEHLGAGALEEAVAFARELRGEDR